MNTSGEAADSYHVLSVAVPRPIDGLFTYKVPKRFLDSIQVGGWVKVPFGKTESHAFVVEPPKASHEVVLPFKNSELKEILAVGDQGSVFTNDVLALCRWASEYYFAPLGEVLHCAVPMSAMGLKSVKQAAREVQLIQRPPKIFQLTEEQSQALEILESARKNRTLPHVALLEGITGSGKTELYLELARKTLAEGRGVLILVPEIALTSQLHQRFEDGLGTTVALWHSAMADGKRRDQSAALRNGHIKVVVGARSSVFAPIQNLGLIVIDEEHDSSYKQEDRVRYHARDLAIVRAQMNQAFVVLGSATPSLETREKVRAGKYLSARLSKRISSMGLPTLEIVDLVKEPMVEGIKTILAKSTLDAIQKTIDAGEQAIIFLNRRGFASFHICHDCGAVKECPNCSISTTVHKKGIELRCHVCGYKENAPDFCEKCLGHNLGTVGVGTEGLEQELPQLLQGAVSLRLDRDQVTSTKRLEQILAEFREKRANLLLGTQMLVKGHDFPGVTLVVVILADALFRWPDFRAPERAFQILKQVSGRAGRGDKPGKVLIQTFSVDHPVIQTINGRVSEEEFLENEFQLRKLLGYPPFGRIARLRFENREQSEAKQRAIAVGRVLKDYQVMGPSEAFLERANGIYRWDLLIKSENIQTLHKALILSKKYCLDQRWPVNIDVDPNGVG